MPQYARRLALGSVLEGSSCYYCPWGVLTSGESDAQRHRGHHQAHWAGKGQSQKSGKDRLLQASVLDLWLSQIKVMALLGVRGHNRRSGWESR